MRVNIHIFKALALLSYRTSHFPKITLTDIQGHKILFSQKLLRVGSKHVTFGEYLV